MTMDRNLMNWLVFLLGLCQNVYIKLKTIIDNPTHS